MKYQKQLFEDEKEENFAAALRQMIREETAKAITEHEEKKNAPSCIQWKKKNKSLQSSVLFIITAYGK